MEIKLRIKTIGYFRGRNRYAFKPSFRNKVVPFAPLRHIEKDNQEGQRRDCFFDKRPHGSEKPDFNRIAGFRTAQCLAPKKKNDNHRPDDKKKLKRLSEEKRKKSERFKNQNKKSSCRTFNQKNLETGKNH